jgi:hypothetical protein
MPPFRRSPLALAIPAAFLFASACGDSTAPNDTLTPEEATELAAQMGAAFATDLAPAAAAGRAGGATLNAIPAPFGVSVDFTVPCPRGGTTQLTASVTGTVDDATESLEANLSGSQRLNECGYLVHGKTIETTGLLTTTAYVKIENGLPAGTHTVNLSGSFDWRASDGRSGTCTVSYNASANYKDRVATVNGNFCGATIHATGPLTT